MPTPLIKKIAKQSGKTIDKIEKYWDKAKEIALEKGLEVSSKQYWPYVYGIVRNMAGIVVEDFMITKRINNLFEKKEEVKIDGKKYELDLKKGIKALVDLHMDNPSLSDDIDYKDDKKRLHYYRKQFSGLDHEDVGNILDDFVGNDYVTINKLISDKVIK